MRQMHEHTSTFIGLIKDFALEPEEVRSPASSKWLPLFDLWIAFGEAKAFFDSNDDKFSDEEAAVIRELDEFIAALPPEPDIHWHEKSLESPLWEETRSRVRRAIAQLEQISERSSGSQTP